MAKNGKCIEQKGQKICLLSTVFCVTALLSHEMQPKAYTTKEIGDLGEEIAGRFLEKKYKQTVVERNYWKKWGEIDVVTREKAGKLHFIEVKTVTHEARGGYRPEENVHPQKLKRMRRVIQSYLLQKSIEDTAWQFDVVTVILDMKRKKAVCRLMPDIVL
jgi:putative endonuclease